MADEYSFDIVSEVDLQHIDDAVNIAMKEITTRFDLKDSGAKIVFDRDKKTLTLTAPSDFQLKQIKEILVGKMTKRGLNPKVLSAPKREDASGGTVRDIYSIICGIETDMAKKIVKDIKDTKTKVQSSIQGDKIRISGKKKDDLQTVIELVKQKNYSIPLQFVNYR